MGGWRGGWGGVAGSNETKANSAQFQVKLRTGAELSNSCYRFFFVQTFNIIVEYRYRHNINGQRLPYVFVLSLHKIVALCCRKQIKYKYKPKQMGQHAPLNFLNVFFITRSINAERDTIQIVYAWILLCKH